MLALRVALRYLFSPKRRQAVNVISWVSLAGVAVAAAAMVVVLSVFNGFGQLAESKLSRFDPGLAVRPARGKAIAGADSLAAAIAALPGVEAAWPVVREQAFASTGSQQMPVMVHAMPPQAALRRLAPITIDGRCELSDSSAMVSVGVALGLSARPGQGAEITVYEPRRVGRINPANPAGAFRQATLRPAGVYQVEQDEYDRDLIILPLATARRLLDYTDEATQIDVLTLPGADAKAVGREISRLLSAGAAPSADFVLLDRLAQQAGAFHMIAIEKWVTFLMLVFILVIASFNIVSSMSMLILEKEANMGILQAMGAPRRMLRAIFASQSVMITLGGGLAGILLGVLLCLGQQHFGWVRLSASDPSLMSIGAYPVVVRWADLPAVLGALAAVSVPVAAVTVLILRQRLRALACADR